LFIFSFGASSSSDEEESRSDISKWLINAVSVHVGSGTQLSGWATSATGIIFNDAAGNERGGIGILDDGSMNFCFDDAKVERNCLFFMPKFGNGIALNDASGESRAILYLDTNGAPHLLLRDDKGQPLVSLPEAPKGSAVK